MSSQIPFLFRSLPDPGFAPSPPPPTPHWGHTFLNMTSQSRLTVEVLTVTYDVLDNQQLACSRRPRRFCKWDDDAHVRVLFSGQNWPHGLKESLLVSKYFQCVWERMTLQEEASPLISTMNQQHREFLLLVNSEPFVLWVAIFSVKKSFWFSNFCFIV